MGFLQKLKVILGFLKETILVLPYVVIIKKSHDVQLEYHPS